MLDSALPVYYYIALVYLSINTLFSIYIYKNTKHLYSEIIVEEEGKQVNVHDKYDAYRKIDKFSFLRIFIGLNLFFWIKAILGFISVFSLSIFLKLSHTFLKHEWFQKKGFNFFMSLSCFFFGFRIKKQRNKCEELYKEYFGENYNFSYDSGFSLIISNHTSWIDTMVYMSFYSCGFIAKEATQYIPLIGVISKQIGCLFLDRLNANDRQAILKQIENKQSQFLDGTITDPLLIFPEGTVTNGKFLLNFKKGAFYSLNPVKPVIINSVLNENFHLSIGCTGIFVHLLRTFCYLYHNVTITELPIMVPTDYMYENYSKSHPEVKDKWEIFSIVAREIVARSGNLIKSELTLRDSIVYENILNNKGHETKNE